MAGSRRSGGCSGPRRRGSVSLEREGPEAARTSCCNEATAKIVGPVGLCAFPPRGRERSLAVARSQAGQAVGRARETAGSTPAQRLSASDVEARMRSPVSSSSTNSGSSRYAALSTQHSALGAGRGPVRGLLPRWLAAASRYRRCARLGRVAVARVGVYRWAQSGSVGVRGRRLQV